MKLSNFVRRAAFALRFGSLDPLISGQINSNTKLLMERDIRARVTKLAPFLQFDADPYPVVLGNKTVWIMDGYTTTDRYPYAQSLSGEGSLSSAFNYVRNSVKVTVDAYNGTVTFYVFDKKDPIIKAYREAFPDLFTDGSQMPTEIRDHLRYPEDLFRSQSAMFGRYHVTEPKRFYDGSAKWLVSPDPGSGRVSSDFVAIAESASGASSGSGSNTQPQAATSTGKRIDPYYLNIRLPGQKVEHFIVLEPFVPVSSGNSQTRLVSFLTADSDPGQYGKLQSFAMPQGQTVEGPVQVNNAIIRTPAISTAITLLNQQGSQIIQGSMQLIPIGNSILYVRPFYAQGRGQGSYPLFQFVVVYTQDYGAYCGQTVQDGLDQMLGRADPVTACNVSAGASSGGTGSGSPTTTTTTTPPRVRLPPPRRRPARPSRRRRAARRTSSTRPRPSSTRPRRRSRPATWASTSAWSTKPAPWSSRPSSSRAGSGFLHRRRHVPRLGIASGIVTMGVVEIPVALTGSPVGSSAWPYPGSISGSTSSGGPTAPTTTSTRPRRA